MHVHVPVEASICHFKSVVVEVSGRRLTLPVCFYTNKAAAVLSCKQKLVPVIRFFSLQ